MMHQLGTQERYTSSDVVAEVQRDIRAYNRHRHLLEQHLLLYLYTAFISSYVEYIPIG
jgi:hypothetical protein